MGPLPLKPWVGTPVVFLGSPELSGVPRVLAVLLGSHRSLAAPQAASTSGFVAGCVKLGRQTELFAYQEEGLAS